MEATVSVVAAVKEATVVVAAVAKTEQTVLSAPVAGTGIAVAETVAAVTVAGTVAVPVAGTVVVAVAGTVAVAVVGTVGADGKWCSQCLDVQTQAERGGHSRIPH